MKKNILFAVLIITALVASAAIYYLLDDTNIQPVQAQSSQNASRKMLKELQREQRLLEQERRRLQQYERNLKNFEAEVERRYNEYLKQAKDLEDKEKDFQKRLEDQMVNRQTIETYESIRPNQAAILLKNLYQRDPALTALLMRKIAGKKAGKILEAMITIDKETATRLAKESLEYFKPK